MPWNWEAAWEVKRWDGKLQNAQMRFWLVQLQPELQLNVPQLLRLTHCIAQLSVVPQPIAMLIKNTP